MATNQSLAPNRSKTKFSVAIQSDAYKNLINQTLQNPQRAQRFIASISSAVSANPALQECDAGTILSSALLGEALNLPASPQLACFYLIPYDDKKRGCKVAQFQLGVAGYRQLCLRSGQYVDLDTIEVREGEYKGRNPENGKPVFEFISDDEVRENLPIVGYLAYFELKSGFKKSVYWSAEKAMNHADKYSQAFKKSEYLKYVNGEIPKSDLWKYSSPWYSQFHNMALKSVLKNLISKWGVLSIDIQQAIEYDQGVPVVKDGKITGVEYVDNSGTETDMQNEQPVIEVPSAKSKKYEPAKEETLPIAEEQSFIPVDDEDDPLA